MLMLRRHRGPIIHLYTNYCELLMWGVKPVSWCWAVTHVPSPAAIKRERHGRRISRPNHDGPGLLRGVRGGTPPRTRQVNVQLAPSSWQKFPQCEGTVRDVQKGGGGDNHNCRIKCQGTTFPAALMWKGQKRRVILANATHRKEGGWPTGQALE